MPRVSRADSQARTKEKLVATATKCFLRDGYAATTLETIADRAGFSKGAVYSNFESKEALCIEVLENLRASRAASLAAAISGTGSTEERIDAFEAWAERHIGDRAWTALEAEFGVHASRHPKLAERLVKGNEAIRALVGGAVSEYARETGMALPMPADEVALALLSLGVGLGLQRALDPTLSVRSLGLLLRVFASGDGPRTRKKRAT